MDAQTLIQILTIQFGYTGYVFAGNLKGLSDEDGLKAGLAGLTTEGLAAAAPFSPGNNPEETVGSLLAGLAFHEGYHCGQLGVLRRMVGWDGVIK